MRILSFGQEDPLEREWQPIPVFVPRKPHEQRSLVGYIVHGVAKSRVQLSDFNFHIYIY